MELFIPIAAAYLASLGVKKYLSLPQSIVFVVAVVLFTHIPFQPGLVWPARASFTVVSALFLFLYFANLDIPLHVPRRQILSVHALIVGAAFIVYIMSAFHISIFIQAMVLGIGAWYFEINNRSGVATSLIQSIIIGIVSGFVIAFAISGGGVSPVNCAILSVVVTFSILGSLFLLEYASIIPSRIRGSTDHIFFSFTVVLSLIATIAPLPLGLKNTFVISLFIGEMIAYHSYFYIKKKALRHPFLKNYFMHTLQYQQFSRMRDHIILCGYNHFNQDLAKLLLRQAVPFLILDINHALTKDARQEGYSALYATSIDTESLFLANISHARAIVLSGDDEWGKAAIITKVRTLNPHLYIMATADVLSTKQRFIDLGAHSVLVPEEVLMHTIWRKLDSLSNHGKKSQTPQSSRFERVRTEK